MNKLPDYFRSSFQGTAKARAAHAKALLQHPGIASGIRELERALPPDPAADDDSPIFLLSAGWRSGSTLVQRLIMSDSGVVIWGEPYDECGMIQALAGSVRAFRPGWPPADYFYDGRPFADLSGEWIANLFPGLEDWRRSHRALFDTLFAEPARHAGAKRWGIKEVRLDIEHCAYLRWLYPKAQFVFLYRDPLEAYKSYCRYERDWYDVFPDAPMFTPAAFGRHWQKLLQGYLDQEQAFNALTLRYEDLVAGNIPLERIEQHLGIAINHGLLRTKVGSSGEDVWVSRLDRWLLRRAVNPLAERLGYRD